MRDRLDQGADPNVAVSYLGPPLHIAAETGSPEVVAELARRVDDADAMWEGRTALWRAVAVNRPDNARVLAAAGADPRRNLMAGWSPERLGLAGSTPDLFGSPQASLTPEETAMVEESRRLVAVLSRRREGLGVACAAGIDVAEAVRRLDAEVVQGDYEATMAAWESDPVSDDVIRTMWATEVPGGCVLAQPWGFGPSMPRVNEALSVGTTCYGMYANPKSGNQGSISRDGEILGWDLHPGGGVADEHDDSAEVLLTYLYQGQALAYCFAYAGLRPVDERSVSGPPDQWLRLPDRDYWASAR
ncbi:ankyrin repeat domain-containing protein [Flindersiella endophytica]